MIILKISAAIIIGAIVVEHLVLFAIYGWR